MNYKNVSSIGVKNKLVIFSDYLGGYWHRQSFAGTIKILAQTARNHFHNRPMLPIMSLQRPRNPERLVTKATLKGLHHLAGAGMRAER
jgi:hypothetical protein